MLSGFNSPILPPRHEPAGRACAPRSPSESWRQDSKSVRSPAGPILLILLGAFLLTACRQQPASLPPTITAEHLDARTKDLIHQSRQAVLAAPQSADVWGKLGQVFHAFEFFPEAQTCYSRAAELDAKSPRWLHLLGVLQLQDQPELALEHLAQAANLAAGSPDAPQVRLAQALVERGQYAEAGTHIQALLRADPAHAAARLESARIHLAGNEIEQAIANLQPCLTNVYSMRAATLLLSQARQRQGDTDAAAQLARRAAELPRFFDWPDPFLREVQALRADRQKLSEQANGLLQQQRLKEAETALAQLLSAYPEDAEGLLLLGRLRYQERKCAEAEQALRRHLAAQTNSLNGLVQLSLALLCQQRWADAVPSLQTAIALKPDFTQAHYNLGYALARAGDSQGAIRSFREALRSSPGDLSAHLALAEELFLAGQREEAFAQLSRAEQLAPGHPKVKQLRTRLESRR